MPLVFLVRWTKPFDQPWLLKKRDEGLSEHWHRGDQVIGSATIITTEPNELMASIHDRMRFLKTPAGARIQLHQDFRRKLLLKFGK
jgi:putative SOS response-associated peptidase YedK